MWLYLHCGVRVGRLAEQPGGWLTHPGHPTVPAPPWEHQSLVMSSVEVGKWPQFGLTQELDEKPERNWVWGWNDPRTGLTPGDSELTLSLGYNHGW